MLNLLEVVQNYNDTSWKLTFYFIFSLAILIGAFWAYMQIFVKKNKNGKKEPLKENVIYNHSNDVIEDENVLKKKTKKNKN